jgi:capsular polysaccharide transport system permease protein
MQAFSENLFLRQLSIMGRIVTAIILREVKTRFGRHRFGFIWILLEPILFVGGFVLLRGFLIERNIPFGQNLALFMISGLLTLRTILSMASRGLSALTANKAMLVYPMVKPIDFILARIVLEAMVGCFTWTVFFGLARMMGDDKIIYHHERVALAFGMVVLLGGSLAFLNAVLAPLSSLWERLWSLIRLPLMLISGIFYVPILMSPTMQAVIWWNPVLHCIELLRTGLYQTYDPMLSIPYILIFSMISLALALVLERNYRHLIQDGG